MRSLRSRTVKSSSSSKSDSESTIEDQISKKKTRKETKASKKKSAKRTSDDTLTSNNTSVESRMKRILRNETNSFLLSENRKPTTRRAKNLSHIDPESSKITVDKPKKPKKSAKNSRNSFVISSPEISKELKTPINTVKRRMSLKEEEQTQDCKSPNATPFLDYSKFDYVRVSDVSDVTINAPLVNSTFNTSNSASNLNATFDVPIVNRSGEWQVQNITGGNSIKLENSAVLLQQSNIESPGQSMRKKWQKFAYKSVEANSILEQINSPRNSLVSKKSNKQRNEKIKRTKMPNFVRIHQKNYENMESLPEYSERKRERAQFLLSDSKSGNKKQALPLSRNKENLKGTKTSKKLFKDNDKLEFNRFGFKMRNIQKKSPVIFRGNTMENVPAAQNVLVLKKEKQPLFERKDVVAVANKKKTTAGDMRDNRRDFIKGVRTNRRFDLLMKMRNTEM